MPSTSQSPTRFRRTATGDAQDHRDPGQEFLQVAGLVERRRLQNRIAQRNYRNKIRDRLEALEALVERTDKAEILNSGATKPPSHPKRSLSGNVSRSKPIEDDDTRPAVQDGPPELPPENSDPWGDMDDFLDNPTADLDDQLQHANPNPSHHNSLGHYQHVLPNSPLNLTENTNNPHSHSPIANIPSPPMTSTHSFYMPRLETAIPPRDPCDLSDSTTQISQPNISASQNSSPPPQNAFNYACPYPPVAMPSPAMPLTPLSTSFPSRAHSATDQQQQQPESYFQPLPLPPQHPHQHPQQHPQQHYYVWVPIPVPVIHTPPPCCPHHTGTPAPVQQASLQQAGLGGQSSLPRTRGHSGRGGADDR